MEEVLLGLEVRRAGMRASVSLSFMALGGPCGDGSGLKIGNIVV